MGILCHRPYDLLPLFSLPLACSGLIVVTLAVCWMPNQVRRIMAAAKPKHDWTKSYFRAYMILLPFSDTFFYLSSVVNPLLYNVSSQQFRSVFGQVLRCRLTLPHANQEKHLRAHVASTMDSARSARRPLIFPAARRSSSSARANKVFLSTFHSEAKPESKPQELSCEAPEPNLEMKPANPATGNGFQEHEVWLLRKAGWTAKQHSLHESHVTFTRQYVRNCAPIGDRSGTPAWEEQPATEVSAKSWLCQAGLNSDYRWGQLASHLLPSRTHQNSSSTYSELIRIFSPAPRFFFTLSSLFPKELKEQIPLPTQDKRTPRRISGSRGGQARRTMQEGLTSPPAFSSVPRKGLSWGARWCWEAMAEGPRRSCSFSWAGARCKEGCCSSWCTPSSVSPGSRRTGTRPRRWGRLPTTHTTCGTWFLQQTRRSEVSLPAPGRGRSPSLKPATALPLTPPTAQNLGGSREILKVVSLSLQSPQPVQWRRQASFHLLLTVFLKATWDANTSE